MEIKLNANKQMCIQNKSIKRKRDSCFLSRGTLTSPLSQKTHVRLTGESKLAMDVMQVKCTDVCMQGNSKIVNRPEI